MTSKHPSRQASSSTFFSPRAVTGKRPLASTQSTGFERSTKTPRSPVHPPATSPESKPSYPSSEETEESLVSPEQEQKEEELQDIQPLPESVVDVSNSPVTTVEIHPYQQDTSVPAAEEDLLIQSHTPLSDPPKQKITRKSTMSREYPYFSGSRSEDVTQWYRLIKVQSKPEISEYDKEDQPIMLATLMGGRLKGEAKDFLDDLSLEYKYDPDILKDKLCERFPPVTKEERYEEAITLLGDLKQHEKEDVQDYIKRCRRLNYELDNMSALVERMIKGLLPGDVKNSLGGIYHYNKATKTPLKFETAAQTIINMEEKDKGKGAQNLVLYPAQQSDSVDRLCSKIDQLIGISSQVSQNTGPQKDVRNQISSTVSTFAQQQPQKMSRVAQLRNELGSEFNVNDWQQRVCHGCFRSGHIRKDCNEAGSIPPDEYNRRLSAFERQVRDRIARRTTESFAPPPPLPTAVAPAGTLSYGQPHEGPRVEEHPWSSFRANVIEVRSPYEVYNGQIDAFPAERQQATPRGGIRRQHPYDPPRTRSTRNQSRVRFEDQVEQQTQQQQPPPVVAPPVQQDPHSQQMQQPNVQQQQHPEFEQQTTSRIVAQDWPPQNAPGVTEPMQISQDQENQQSQAPRRRRPRGPPVKKRIKMMRNQQRFDPVEHLRNQEIRGMTWGQALDNSPRLRYEIQQSFGLEPMESNPGNSSNPTGASVSFVTPLETSKLANGGHIVTRTFETAKAYVPPYPQVAGLFYFDCTCTHRNRASDFRLFDILIDNGAAIIAIPRSVAIKMGLKIFKIPKKTSITGFAGNEAQTDEYAEMTIYPDKVPQDISAYVIDDGENAVNAPKHSLLLGKCWIDQHKVTADYWQVPGTMTFWEGNKQHRIYPSKKQEMLALPPVESSRITKLGEAEYEDEDDYDDEEDEYYEQQVDQANVAVQDLEDDDLEDEDEEDGHDGLMEMGGDTRHARRVEKELR